MDFLSGVRQPDFIGRPQNFLGKIVQTDPDPAGVLQGHPGMTPMEKVGGRDNNAVDLLYLGAFRGQEEIKLLFQQLIKGTLMTETGLHELALLALPEMLVHFFFPGALRSLLTRPAPGQVLVGRFTHDAVEITG